MTMTLDATLTPAELPALSRADLDGTACAVFDVLRATSSFVTGLAHGAQAVIPVDGIEEARALRRRRPEALLGGERRGLRIEGFDLGNSPREYATDAVRGKVIVSTTTNGTRALRASAKARLTLAASFLNLSATVDRLLEAAPSRVLLVCAGTAEEASLEDALAAGAVAAALQERRADLALSDAARLVLGAYRDAAGDLAAAAAGSENARRLLERPALRDDVAFCLRRDVFPLVAVLGPDGALRRA